MLGPCTAVAVVPGVYPGCHSGCRMGPMGAWLHGCLVAWPTVRFVAGLLDSWPDHIIMLEFVDSHC